MLLLLLLLLLLNPLHRSRHRDPRDEGDGIWKRLPWDLPAAADAVAGPVLDAGADIAGVGVVERLNLTGGGALPVRRCRGRVRLGEAEQLGDAPLLLVLGAGVAVLLLLLLLLLLLRLVLLLL